MMPILLLTAIITLPFQISEGSEKEHYQRPTEQQEIYVETPVSHIKAAKFKEKNK